MSLDRLINLARRTGDRLIVHNPSDEQDVVIMLIDEYESLLAERESVYRLSSGQLLDRINRDIAVWRASKEQDESLEKTKQLENELWEEEMEEMPPRALWDDDWHHAGRVLSDRYQKDFFDDDEFADDDFGGEDDEETDRNLSTPGFGDDDESGWDETDADWPGSSSMLTGHIGETMTDYAGNNSAPNLGGSANEPDDDEKIKVEHIPFKSGGSFNQKWEDEPLPGDEPLFYEEPV